MSKHAFQSTYTLEARREFSDRCRTNHPGNIPIYVYIHPSYHRILELRNNKYIVSGDYTVAEFKHMLTVSLQPTNKHTHVILMFTDKGELPVATAPIVDLYERQKDTDGILYVQLIGESTFG